MAGNTSQIEWTGISWKTVAGCTPVSKGCQKCYAVMDANRYRGSALKRGDRSSPYLDVVNPNTCKWTGKINLINDSLREPFGWNTPSAVFVNSESDTFHKDVPDGHIRRLFSIMNWPRFDPFWFQLLTKRAERLAKLGPTLPWLPNIWAGVTVENADHLDRVDQLRQCGASGMWLSLEPLLGPLDDLDLSGINWVVTGGMSKTGGDDQYRIRPEWVRDIRRKCRAAKVPFFFKQWGHSAYNPYLAAGEPDPTASGENKHKGGCLLDGRVYHEVPKQFKHLFTAQKKGATR